MNWVKRYKIEKTRTLKNAASRAEWLWIRDGSHRITAYHTGENKTKWRF